MIRGEVTTDLRGATALAELKPPVHRATRRPTRLSAALSPWPNSSKSWTPWGTSSTNVLHGASAVAASRTAAGGRQRTSTSRSSPLTCPAPAQQSGAARHGQRDRRRFRNRGDAHVV